MAVRNTYLIAGYGHLQSSHQGDHQEIAGYCVGYGPLQRSHCGDHHEIASFQSSHQGYRVLIDQCSYRCLVVGQSVRLSVGPLVLELYEKVIFRVSNGN